MQPLGIAMGFSNFVTSQLGNGTAWPLPGSRPSYNETACRYPTRERRVAVTMADEPDGMLLFRLNRGDEMAYRELFRKHERRAYRVALLMMRSTWDAEEVVASAFFELWRKRDKVRLVDGSVLPWLLTVLSFMAKNHQRGTRRYRRLLAKLPHSGSEPDHAEEVARTVDALPASEAVQNALAELNARDVSILLLCVVQELSTRDAALALSVPEGTVKSRLSRVKARLRTQLSAYAPSAREAGA